MAYSTKAFDDSTLAAQQVTVEPVPTLQNDPEKESVPVTTSNNEKLDHEKDVEDSIDLQVVEELDLYEPFPTVPGTEEKDVVLTIRAVLVGSLLGCLVTASNTYLGTVESRYCTTFIIMLID